MTDLLWRFWWVALIVAYAAVVTLICHAARIRIEAWCWWRTRRGSR